MTGTIKVSAIPASATPLTATDSILGVQASQDVLFSGAQVTAAVQGSTYYVSTSGSDTATGLSQSAPWKTIAHVNAQTFNPGTSILFKGGQQFNGSIVSPSSGTDALPITFGSYGGNQATIFSGVNTGFISTNQSGIIVRDLIFAGSVSANYGISFVNTLTATRLQNIQMLNCTVTNYGFNGINVIGGVPATDLGYDHVLIDGCTVSGCTGHAGHGILTETAGIFVGFGSASSNTNVTISNCVSHDNAGCTDVSLTGSGIIIEETKGGLVYNCVAYNNGASANCTNGGGPAGIWCNNCSYITFDSCSSYNNSTGNTIDGNGLDIDVGSTFCTLRNCLSFGNYGSGLLIFGDVIAGLSLNDHNSIIDCVSINDAAGILNTAGITLFCIGSNANTNVIVSGNKVYISNAASRGIAIEGSGAGTTTGVVSGNTISVSGTQHIVHTSAFQNPTGLLFTNNDYRSTAAGACIFNWNSVNYVALNDWIVATGQESSGFINGVASRVFTISGAAPFLLIYDTETNGKGFQLNNFVNGTTPGFGLSLNTSPNFPDIWTANWDNLLSFQLSRDAAYGWSTSATSSAANMDTGISRSAAAAIAFGNGTPGNASAKLLAGSVVVSADPGGTASTNTLSNANSTTISTGVGSVKMSTGNPGTNTGWLKCYIGTQVAWIPTWTTNAP